MEKDYNEIDLHTAIDVLQDYIDNTLRTNSFSKIYDKSVKMYLYALSCVDNAYAACHYHVKDIETKQLISKIRNFMAILWQKLTFHRAACAEVFYYQFNAKQIDALISATTEAVEDYINNEQKQIRADKGWEKELDLCNRLTDCIYQVYEHAVFYDKRGRYDEEVARLKRLRTKVASKRLSYPNYPPKQGREDTFAVKMYGKRRRDFSAEELREYNKIMRRMSRERKGNGEQ